MLRKLIAPAALIAVAACANSPTAEDSNGGLMGSGARTDASPMLGTGARTDASQTFGSGTLRAQPYNGVLGSGGGRTDATPTDDGGGTLGSGTRTGSLASGQVVGSGN